jgi:small conductance mechanosensitive channel
MISWKALLDSLTKWFMVSGLRILLVIIGTLIATRLITAAIKKLEVILTGKSGDSVEQQKRIRTLTGILRKTVKVSAFIVAVIIILTEVGVDIRPIITAAGIGGLALGFGAQSLVRDVISGFFMLLEDQIRVGDVVALNDTSGEVISLNLRTTVLRDLSGAVHIFPNGSINSVSNMTKDWSRYVIDVGVAYGEDVDYVMEVLKKIGDELHADPEFRQYILEPLDVLGVDNFGPSEIIIKAMITTVPLKQWFVGRELRRRIKKTFDELGIEIPFPHTTVYWGKTSRPFSINIDQASKHKGEQIDE